MKTKKSQAGIIGAVLLILIVLVVAMIVMSFVVPFVRDRLEGGGCLDVAGEIEITNNLQYTCYNATADNMSVQIHYGDIENLTQGFQITIGSSGASESFEVVPETSDSITMLGGGSVELPGKNEERTYILGGIDPIPEFIEVYPILSNGNACDASSSLTKVSNCFTP